ncbi:non-specific lipid transfer protein GPI-anchored 20-like [Nymphaea colorata]|uniref:non-specific lipid transfer protein GPI-anchored 20-like n=1 Tax=Nymphaea colorata TaxID=210225 RepID=UPI00129EE651|nr:non-specific lipid transfer protein GPI-anchored 20-like [Nymphaea colorata]
MEMMSRLITLLILSMAVFPAVFSPVSAQMVTPCTMSMVNGFTPCLSYVTGVGASGRSPSSDCCAALSSMVSSSSGCLCLIMSANPPLQAPINQALAVALPQACGMPSSAVQCQDNSSALSPPASGIPGTANPPSTGPPVTTTDASAPGAAAAPPAPVQVVPPPVLPTPTTVGTGSPRTIPNSAQKIHGCSVLFMLASLVLGSCML